MVVWSIEKSELAPILTPVTIIEYDRRQVS
jgi:hypothetical protein